MTLESEFPVVFETPVARGEIFDDNKKGKTALPDSVRPAILKLEAG